MRESGIEPGMEVGEVCKARGCLSKADIASICQAGGGGVCGVLWYMPGENSVVEKRGGYRCEP